MTHNNNGFNEMLTTTPCKTDREQFKPGDNVKRFDVERGWIFGRVIGIHFGYSNHLWYATVRFIGHGDMSVPQFFLESYPGEPAA